MDSLLPILLCSSLLTTTATAGGPVTYCPIGTSYTAGSAFQANLDALLSSLTAASSDGFASNTTGATPDQAYGLAQCRADLVGSSACRACLDDSAQDLAAIKCAGRKKAMLFYDECLLRYSADSFSGAVDMSEVVVWVNGANATEQARFMSRLGALMSKLTKTAPRAPRMFAAGSATVTTSRIIIYGMAQCTRDLAADDCSSCLGSALGYVRICCDGRQGGQVIRVSCSVRFEVYQFYNLQAAEAAMSPEPPPPAGSRSVNGESKVPFLPVVTRDESFSAVLQRDSRPLTCGSCG